MALATSPTFSLTPAPTQQVLSSNYISTFDFSDVELPDTYKENFEIYGNRTIASFLRAASAELPSSSDLIKWTEEGRLHTLYTEVTRGASGSKVFTKNGHNFRLNQTVIISDGTNIKKGIISAKDANTFTVEPFDSADFTGFGTTAISCYVYGSEFKKGTNGMVGALEAVPSFHETNPIIIKDKYEVSGSDMTQIGWVEVSTEGGGSGYLWYLKSHHETRLRFEDYLEMSMVEGTPAAGSSAAETAGYKGTKGLFYEIGNRGNVFNGVMSAKADFDAVLKRLDKQGSILENMFFADRDQNLAIDDFLATQNSLGDGGTSYGAFNNDKQMALNLGFYGFTRGSYEFYKTDWKYLNDATTRGSIAGNARVRAVVVPSGTKTVYDEILGQKIRQPFLHVKYRKSATEDRKYKSWVLGSAGGASNSELDAMQVHFLSERALVVIGANNFVLVQG